MAVEARHLNLFPPPQLIPNSELMSAIEGYNAPIGYGMPPLSGTTTETSHLPMYGSAMADSFPSKITTATKAESGLTYNLPISRKRPRDPILNPYHNPSYNNRSGSYTFLGEDISLQIQLQQLEIDRFIAQHAEKVRLEMEERRKRDSRKIMVAVEEGVMKKLRAKEEEIDKIGRLNWALEEKVKSLCVENQIWRELAQSNEATANVLRSNLEQVLAQVDADDHHRHHRAGGGAVSDDALADDAQSCCDSNHHGADEEENGGRCTLAGRGGEREGVKDKGESFGGNVGWWWCRRCGKEESCVLVLPCRHLCLCSACGSSVHTCPICNSSKNATLQVNMSSS